ncbi:restriction endonuclease [Devosia sp. Root436]|uniref:restriction endonuclease n=1 Tax=Devosia sp. Root436 TaxID=1736537 RepID=UPI000ABA44B8|nr:restriction endonuclease [Devosia sp. Root436]
MNDTPDDLARLIHEALEIGDWDGDPAVLANRVRRLDLGLPVEDEFMVLCAWLGKCQLIHKLDQAALPVMSKELYQVPDLMAAFSTQVGGGPVLIEVKSKSDRVLSFKPSYLEKLRNYASLVGAHLLIAWKFHSVWILFEAKHLKKAVSNFNISFDLAMKENLLGVLAGDQAYKIGAGAGIHLKMQKEKLIETVEGDNQRTETWQMRVAEVMFSDRTGQMMKSLSPDTQTLFTTWDLHTNEEHAEDHIWIRHVSTGDGLQFGHTALVRLLEWHLPDGAKLHWRRQFRAGRIASLEDFRGALARALDEGVIHLILDQMPHTMPDFVEPPASLKQRGAKIEQSAISSPAQND